MTYEVGDRVTYRDGRGIVTDTSNGLTVVGEDSNGRLRRVYFPVEDTDVTDGWPEESGE